MKNVLTILMVTGVLALAGTSRGALTDNMVGLYHFDGNMNDSAPGSSEVGTLYAVAQLVDDTVQVGTHSLNTQNGAMFEGDPPNRTWSFGTLPEGSEIDGSNNWTLSVWVQSKGDDDWTNPLAFSDGGFRLEDGQPGWRFYNTGYGNISSHDFAKTEWKWQFFAIVADGTTLKVYQGSEDGNDLTEAYSATIASGESLNGGNTLVLGKRTTDPADGGNQKNCYLDEIGIWERGLSSSEVQEVFDAGVAGNTIPEPATMCLLAFGGLLSSRKR